MGTTSLVFSEHRLIAERFHDFHNGTAAAHCFGHLRLVRGDLLCFGDDLLRARRRNDDDAAAVGDHEIAGMDLHTAALDFLINTILHDAPPRGHGHDRACVNRKAYLTALVDIAAGAVDDDAAELLLLRRE